MLFKTLDGSQRRVNNYRRYFVDWDGSSRSKVQKRVKDILVHFWRHDMVFEEMPMVGSKLSFDFFNFNKKIAVEVQGRQHHKFVPHFHGSFGKFRKQMKYDDMKLKWCDLNDIELVEILETDELTIEKFKEYGIR